MYFNEKANNRATDAWLKKTWSGITPTGSARFPKLNEPDLYDPTKPKWVLGLAWDKDDLPKGLEEELTAMIDWAYEQLPPSKQKKTTKIDPLRTESRLVNKGTPEEDEEETGRVFINAWAYAEGRDGKRTVLPAFDANAQPVPMPEVGGGSQVRASLWIRPYWMDGKLGLSMRLNGVQIIQLSEGFSGPSFEATEGWSQADEVAKNVSEVDAPFG